MPTQTMTATNLTAGFHNIIKLQARDQAHVTQVTESVHWNAGLLNALITRVNAIESSQKLEVVRVDQLQNDVQTAVGNLDLQDHERDKKLREELYLMATKLEAGHAEIQEKLNKLSVANPVDQPPGIASGNNLLDGLQKQVGAIQMATDQFHNHLQGMEKHLAPVWGCSSVLPLS